MSYAPVMVWCRGATETEDTTTTNLICDRSYTQQDVAQDNWRLLLLTRGTLFNRGSRRRRRRRRRHGLWCMELGVRDRYAVIRSFGSSRHFSTCTFDCC